MMKSRIKQSISLFLAVIMLSTTLLIAPFTASAAVKAVNEQDVQKLNFWADPVGDVDPSSVVQQTIDETSTVSAMGLVQAHTVGNKYSSSNSEDYYYLFLPTLAKLDSLVLYFDNNGSDTTEITTPSNSKVTITKGVPTNVFSGYGEKYTATSTWKIKINGEDQNFHVVKSANVATMYINTKSGSTQKIHDSNKHTYREPGTIQVYQADGTKDYDGWMDRLGGHGNGTWETDNAKNSYNLKINKSTSLLGMPKAKKWVLLGHGYDGTNGSNENASLIRNNLTYDFADYIGVENQPDYDPVDLYCNGHYMGSYILVEKPEIKSNRIDVIDAYENLEIANGTTDPITGITTPADFDTLNMETKLSPTSRPDTLTGCTVGNKKYSTINSGKLQEPDDITGGYLFGIEIADRWVNELNGFCGYARQGWTVRSCDYMSDGMIDYCYDLLYAMGAAVYQDDGNVPSKTTEQGGGSILTAAYKASCPPPAQKYQGMHWNDILDADSAVTYYWTQEFFKNMDASTSSTYFYKNSDSVDSKVYAGPIWDSDNTMCTGGSRYGLNYGDPNNWYVKEQKIYKFYSNTKNTTTKTLYDASAYTFYAALSKQNDFWAMAEEKWLDTVSPAVDVLLGKAPASGRLHSIDWYIEEIKESALMNNIRLAGVNATYNKDNCIKDYLTNWITRRQTFVNTQIGPANINNASAQGIEDQRFTGAPIEPKVELTYNNPTLGKQELVEGTDYTLSYNNNVNLGTATVTITGINRFSGTKTLTFKILANTIESGTLTIYDGAYLDDEVVPNLTDRNGTPIVKAVKFHWYLDGEFVITSPTYTVKNSDSGKTLHVIAEGDDTKQIVGSLKSNDCPIADTTRPDGTIRNLATFNYKYGNDGTSLVGNKKEGYAATSGLQKENAKLFGSVDGKDYNNLEWSGSDTFTLTNGKVDQQPILSPSSSSPWKEYPVIDVSFSTEGFTDITFSADIGATNKGPAFYSLQYSVDGGEFKYIVDKDNEDIYYEITKNKLMGNGFNLTLPKECDDKNAVTVRIIADSPYTVAKQADLFGDGKYSGKIAINNVLVDGTKDNMVTDLKAPNIVTENASPLYTDEIVTIKEPNNGADIYYTLTDSKGSTSEPYTYKEKGFAPFEKMKSETITVTAWCELGIYSSEKVSKIFNHAGDALARFEYTNYSSEVVDGKLPSSGGSFGKSSFMTTIVDSKTQYVPFFRPDKGAYVIAPDDGLLWSADSGFYFEVSTSGYDSIAFSCDAYTTEQGPNSMSLAYSLDGTTWTNVVTNKTLTANKKLENYMDKVVISGIENARKVYIRLNTQENKTNSGDKLHNGESKGNVYINNVLIGGKEIDDVIKMPYTTKTTDYFGKNGTVKYSSPDGIPMQYTVTNSKGKIVLSGAYPSDGIQLSLANGFNPYVKEPYTINIWAGDDDDRSIANVRTYFYKGDTVAEYSYTENKFNNNANENKTLVNSTKGTGTLSMYPGGETAASMEYKNSNSGIRTEASTENGWKATKKLDNPNGNGFWLITASTLGYTDLTLTLDQTSSNKGPRDWGLAYSTDGINYTYISNSNIRNIGLDSVNETYANIPLPKELNNKETVYIKVFINGGENFAEAELDIEPDKGNTSINNIEICGLAEAQEVTATMFTTVLENREATSGTTPVAGIDVYVNGDFVGKTAEDGKISFTTTKNVLCTVYFDNGTFCRTIKFTPTDDVEKNVPLMVLDVTKDGCVNISDLSDIDRKMDEPNRTFYMDIFRYFMCILEKEFEYADID